MAWQLGLKEYKQIMKVSKNRKKCIENFTNDQNFSKYLRKFVRLSMLEIEEGATLTEMTMAFSAFQSETETSSE